MGRLHRPLGIVFGDLGGLAAQSIRFDFGLRTLVRLISSRLGVAARMAPYAPKRDVPIAEYLYRHEAEFAAGFLEDAGIPFRLQADDAGGAEVGVTISRPARLWVRVEDVEHACEVLDIPTNVDVSAEPEDEEASGLFIRKSREHGLSAPPHSFRGTTPSRDLAASALCATERVVAGALSAVFLGLALTVAPQVLTDAFAVVSLFVAVVFGIAAVVGHSVGPFRAALRGLSGNLP